MGPWTVATRVLSTPRKRHVSIVYKESVIEPVKLGIPARVMSLARYVWIRLTLDDTATTDASDATTIDEITIGHPIVEDPGGCFYSRLLCSSGLSP